MIEHLRHQAIDKGWWDTALEGCGNRLWYARSAVLDAACPGWEALVDRTSGAVMPLTVRRKWGFRYLFQPFMVQQLGVFAPRAEQLDTAAFHAAVPKGIDYWDIQLNEAQPSAEVPKVQLSTRTNMVLDLRPGPDALRRAYAESHARGLRKWPSGPLEQLPAASFIRFVRAAPNAAAWNMDAERWRTFERLVHVAMADGARCVALHDAGRPLAAGLFVTWAGRTTFLKGLALAEGRKVFAMHRLMDAMITGSCAIAHTFDMAGGEDAGLRRFYAGFGARPVLYLRARCNRLPQPLRWYKQRSDGA